MTVTTSQGGKPPGNPSQTTARNSQGEVVTCNCVRNSVGHAASNPRPSEEGVRFYHVLRPLDQLCVLVLLSVVFCMLDSSLWLFEHDHVAITAHIYGSVLAGIPGAAQDVNYIIYIYIYIYISTMARSPMLALVDTTG